MPEAGKHKDCGQSGAHSNINDNNPNSTQPEAGQHGSLPATITPVDFLTDIYRHDAPDVWVCSFPPGPEQWQGRRFNQGFSHGINDDHNNYFAIGLLGPEETRRSSAGVIAHHVVFADDIGTKVDRSKWAAMIAMGFPEPRFKIETSPGNETWVWVIDKPVGASDADRVRPVRVLRESFGRLGLSDPLSDDARYIRLPCGVNSKQKYLEEYGFPVPVRLLEWNRGAVLNLDQACGILLGPDWKDKSDEDLGLRAGGGSSMAGALVRTADMNQPEPIIQLGQAVGLNPVQTRAGVVEAICPNAANHTSRADTGFAFLGGGLMECSHAHCQHLRTPDFKRMICEEFDNQQNAREAMGLLLLPGGRTASEFLAAADFNYHDQKAGRSAPDVLDEAGRIAANKRLQQDRLDRVLADMDSRYALVRTHNGIVDRSPANNSLYSVMGSQHFTTHYNGVATVGGGRGRPQGLGSYWINRPETPRYECVGLWPVGQEPAGALNVYAGLPVLSSRAERRALAAGARRSCALVLAFIHDVICSGDTALNDYALDWLAWVVQNPLEKPGVNLVLIGKPGTGKGTLGRMLLDIFGPRYSLHVTQSDHLLGRFSGHLEGVLFVLIDEAMFGKDPRTTGVYKARTTEPTLLVEHKGQTPRTVRNHMAIMILSNSLDAAPVEANDRRATVIDVSDARRQDTAYFGAIWNEWDTLDGRGAFIDFLLARDLSQFDPTKPFHTAAKAAMAAATADPVTSWWLDVLDSGQAPGAMLDPSGKEVDWSAGPVMVPNNILFGSFQTWCRTNRVRHPVSQAEMLRRVGELCPGRAKRKPRQGGKQVHAYVYPLLDAARAEANTALGGAVLDADDSGA